MAVTVTDRRTTITEADTLTDWTGASTLATFFAEATNSVAEAINIGTGQIYFTTTARDLSDTLVYVYSFNNALQNGWQNADPPNALHLGDGTDRVSFKMAGADRRVFNHLDGPTEWQCLVLDGSQASAMNSAGNAVARAGSFAGLNLAAITQIGVDFTTLSKALGGGQNVAVDIIRIGNLGLRITGGTTGDRGSFLEVAIEDRSTATLKAHGILRELGTDVYSTQGPLTFGGATQTAWFDETGVVLIFENRNIGNDKYFFDVEGGTGATHFLLAGSTIKSAGPFVACNFARGGAANIDTLDIDATVFSALGNAVTFGNNAAHSVTNCTFDGCGQVDPGTVIFTGNTITNSTDANGALLIDGDGTSAISDLDVISDGTGHGVRFTVAGTYSLDNWNFTGFGADGTVDAAVVNASGGLVTLNVTGGNTPTVLNLTTSTTVVQNVVNFTLTGLVDNTEVRIYRVSDDVELYGDDLTSGGSTTYQYNYTADTPVYIHIHHVDYVFIRLELTLGGGDASVPVQQRFDRNYSNPV